MSNQPPKDIWLEAAAFNGQLDNYLKTLKRIDERHVAAAATQLEPRKVATDPNKHKIAKRVAAGVVGFLALFGASDQLADKSRTEAPADIAAIQSCAVDGLAQYMRIAYDLNVNNAPVAGIVDNCDTREELSYEVAGEVADFAVEQYKASNR